MRQSRDRILTSHAGSLPRPDELIEANRAREAGTVDGRPGIPGPARTAVADVVRRQRDAGIDVPGDGEFGKSMGHRVNYRAWWSYSFQRLGGLELGAQGLYDMPPQPLRARRRRADELRRSPRPPALRRRVRRSRIRHHDRAPPAALARLRRPRSPIPGRRRSAPTSRTCKAALAAAGVEEGFMTSIAPGSASRIANRYYRTDEEFLFACADAMREEYRAIVDAGLILQLDDPAIAENWDMVNPEPTVEDYRRSRWCAWRRSTTRSAACPRTASASTSAGAAGTGPHTTDIPMRDIVDVMLAVTCGAYSFEAGNVRHEHEWKVWQDVEAARRTRSSCPAS